MHTLRTFRQGAGGTLSVPGLAMHVHMRTRGTLSSKTERPVEPGDSCIGARLGTAKLGQHHRHRLARPDRQTDTLSQTNTETGGLPLSPLCTYLILRVCRAVSAWRGDARADAPSEPRPLPLRGSGGVARAHITARGGASAVVSVHEDFIKLTLAETTTLAV